MPQRTLAASSRADRARLAEQHPMPAHRRRQPVCGWAGRAGSARITPRRAGTTASSRPRRADQGAGGAGPGLGPERAIPRCARSFRMTTGSCSVAISRSRPPQCGHARTSIANARCMRAAQLQAREPLFASTPSAPAASGAAVGSDATRPYATMRSRSPPCPPPSSSRGRGHGLIGMRHQPERDRGRAARMKRHDPNPPRLERRRWGAQPAAGRRRRSSALGGAVCPRPTQSAQAGSGRVQIRVAWSQAPITRTLSGTLHHVKRSFSARPMALPHHVGPAPRR